MAFIQPNKIDEYAQDCTKRPAPFLENLETFTKTQMLLPQMLCGRVEGTFLKLLVQITASKRILELGTYTGYSALSMAQALPNDGKIITCELDEERAKVARGFMDKTPYGHLIEIKVGPALESLQNLEGPFDLAFIDADKENYPNYYNQIVPKMRQGGLIVVDNVLWSGKVLDPKDADSKAIAHLNDIIKEDQRVENVFLTIRDGIHIARIK